MRASAVSTARSVQTACAGELGQSGEAVDQPGVVGRRRRGGGRRRPACQLRSHRPSVAAQVVAEELADGHGRVGPVGLPVAAAASASAEAYMAFHSVSTLSSSPGRTRADRASNSRPRPASTGLGPVERGTDRPAQDGSSLEVARRR